jgi:alkaline phosphatase
MSIQPSFSYRQSYAILCIFSIVVLWATSPFAITSSYGKKSSKLVRHIILFVGGGMQLAHEVAASRYLFGRDDRLIFHGFPYRANVTTWDVTTYNYWAIRHISPTFESQFIQPWLGYDVSQGGIHPYPLQTDRINSVYLKTIGTDSAAATTALATGHKTDRGNVAWRFGDPKAGHLTTISEILRNELGFAIGVASTVPFTHATIAAHLSHNVNRHNMINMSQEIIHTVQPDVVVGGGHPLWYGGFTYLTENDYIALKTNGIDGTYQFIERLTDRKGADALMAAALEANINNKKLFGLFGGHNGNFDSPMPQNRPNDPTVSPASTENPLLKDCVTAALTVLSREPRGFFVMFEQGDIDWANHTNDYRRMIGTIWDLDNAVRTAIEFVDKPGDNIDWTNTLLIVTADHGNSLMRFIKPLGRGELPMQIDAASSPCYADYCGKFLYPDNEVKYGSGGHTNELVRLYALGNGIHLFEKFEGTWYPGTQIIDNTQIFQVMVQATGLYRPDYYQIRNDAR